MNKKYYLDNTKLTESKQTSFLLHYVEEGFRGTNTKIEIIKKSFILLLADFFNSELKEKPDLYVLEAFSSNMLYVVNTPDEIKKADKELVEVLDVAADITFYFTKGEKAGNLEEFNKLIDVLKKYYLLETSRPPGDCK